MTFTDQTVVVTGATGNLGRAVAQTFADGGAALVLVGQHPETLADRFGSEDERRLFVAADLRDSDQAAAVARCAGRISSCVGAFPTRSQFSSRTGPMSMHSAISTSIPWRRRPTSSCRPDRCFLHPAASFT